MGSTRQSLLSVSRGRRRGMAGFLRVLWQALAALPLVSKTLRVPTRKCGVGAPAGDLLHLKQLHAEFYILLTPKLCLR
jgi:hypothetical protein